MNLEKFINWSPLLRSLGKYQKAWLSRDFIAGLSVVAVQIPTAMAYANMAGFPPQVGLYASMLPVIVYGLFSSSRQLVVGPDAATCAMIAALLMPLAHGNLTYYLELMAGLTIMTGLLMVVGGFVHFGFFINFFSFPVLVGYLNGIALSIIAGQLGKIMGITVTERDFLPSLLELAEHINEIQFMTFGLGTISLLTLIFINRMLPRAPAALIALALAGLVAYGFGMEKNGVLLVGVLPSSFPKFSLPGLGYEGAQSIFMDSVGLLVVSFTSGMLTARSFAARNSYSINPDSEMRAVGAANIVSGLFGGFAVTGADSRTAVNDGCGGKTQMVSVIAGLGTACVVLFLSKPLGYLPITALAAVLIFSAWGLLNIAAWKRLYNLCRFEFWLSLLTTVGVLTIGVLPGVVMAISLALFHVLKGVYQPRDALLGQVPGLDGYNDLSLSPESKTLPGIIIYRFEGPLLFFNAELFKSRIHDLIDNTEPLPHWLVLSMESVNQIDVTGMHACFEVHDELEQKGVQLLIARPTRLVRDLGKNARNIDQFEAPHVYPSIRSAVNFALEQNEKVSCVKA
jgi:high affinity sulfate transporter 1